MRLIAKAIRTSHAKFHCNSLKIIVQNIQDYASLNFWHTVWILILLLAYYVQQAIYSQPVK